MSTATPVAPNARATFSFWCFTVNNPDFAPEDLPLHPHERYVVYQEETGDAGTVHLQGYVELSTRSRLTGMKKWLPTAHFESRKGTAAQARDYCMKEESRTRGPWERGTFTDVSPGGPTDFTSFYAMLDQAAPLRSKAYKRLRFT